MRSDFDDIQHKEAAANDGNLKVTAAMFRTVFLEVKKNIAFDSHSSLVSLQEMHGVMMGHHHYEKCGAIAILESMSSHMHTLMIKHMISMNLPFSIILDGSTDSTETKFLIIYFQILDNNIPVMCFYRLVEASSDVTAKGLYESISKAFESEKVDFRNYVKRNLIGYVSDGEAVMSGHRGGLLSYFQANTDNFVYAVHCMAHRLELAIVKSFKIIPYFARFEKFINDLFQFYNLNSSKRKAHLKETANMMKKKLYALNYIYHVRWISSELQSITNLKKMMPVIVNDLEIVRESPQFDKSTQDLASKLVNQFKGKNFLVILHFISDVLHHFSFWSLKMQERTAMLVDFSEFNEKILTTFSHLKNNNGRDLNLFLENAICEEGPCQSLTTYYDSEYVTFENIPLAHDESEGIPQLLEIRERFLDSIIAQIKSYFPSSDLKLFRVFLPKEIPNEIGKALTYGVVEINRLCEVFKMSECLRLVSDWGELLISIIDSEDFCIYKTRNTETHVFWSHFLNAQGIVWSERTKKLIQSILVIPIGSAEAERGFSIFNHIKTSRRSTMLGRHVEDVMRVRINTADDLEKFAASRYAAKFVKDHHLRTDDPRHRKKKVVSLLEEDEMKKKFMPKLSVL